MLNETYLSNELVSAGDSSQYDEHARRLLADIGVLAYILMYAVEEFKDYTFEEAKAAIEGEPEVHSRPVRPDTSKPESIKGIFTESNIPGEGKLFFDIVFTVRSKDNIIEKMYINLEAQKTYYTHYDLVTRGVVYASRLISEQMDVEFTPANYDGAKKVYSIWICMNTPEETRDELQVADSITEYSITPHSIYNTQADNVKYGRYDLLSVVFINLRDNLTEDSSNKLIGMLSTLLTTKKSVEYKKEVLKNEYNLPMTREMEKEAAKMCNLSESIGIEYQIEIKALKEEREIILAEKAQTDEKNFQLSSKNEQLSSQNEKLVSENAALIKELEMLKAQLAAK